MQLLDPQRLHATLAWIPELEAELQRRTGITADEIRAELRSGLAYWLDVGAGPWPADGVPVRGLGWQRGGPVLIVDGAAAMGCRRAAFTGLARVAGDHFVQGNPDANVDLHIALGYATVTWPAGDVQALDAELRQAMEGLTLPAPLPHALLLCRQDTFAPGGLNWTDEHLITRERA